MVKRFEIPELEEIVSPFDLVEVLDGLMDSGKLSSYYYDFENNEVELVIPESVVIEELFTSGKLNPKGAVN